MGCHAFLPWIFLTQGSNLNLLGLLHCRQVLYCWVTEACTSIYHIFMYINVFIYAFIQVIPECLYTCMYTQAYIQTHIFQIHMRILPFLWAPLSWGLSHFHIPVTLCGGAVELCHMDLVLPSLLPKVATIKLSLKSRTYFPPFADDHKLSTYSGNQKSNTES